MRLHIFLDKSMSVCVYVCMNEKLVPSVFRRSIRRAVQKKGMLFPPKRILTKKLCLLPLLSVVHRQFVIFSWLPREMFERGGGGSSAPWDIQKKKKNSKKTWRACVLVCDINCKFKVETPFLSIDTLQFRLVTLQLKYKLINYINK